MALSFRSVNKGRSRRHRGARWGGLGLGWPMHDYLGSINVASTPMLVKICLCIVSDHLPSLTIDEQISLSCIDVKCDNLHSIIRN